MERKKEIDFLNELVSCLSKNKIDYDKRVKNVFERRALWYLRHAESNKILFRLTSTTVILIQAAVAVIGAINKTTVLVVLTVCAFSLQRIMELYFLQENYKRYRDTLEKLTDEAGLYATSSGPYAEISPETRREKIFVENVINISAGENKVWKSLEYRHKDK
jgi:hypothetical protein